MKTLQEIFDFGLNHILKQGEPCVNEFGACAYRNDAGQSCIVGGFFTAETYEPEFDSGDGLVGVEAMVARSDAFNLALDAAGVDTEDKAAVDLLSRMQNCHDRSSAKADFLPSFNLQMQHVAREVNLNYTPPAQ